MLANVAESPVGVGMRWCRTTINIGLYPTFQLLGRRATVYLQNQTLQEICTQISIQHRVCHSGTVLFYLVRLLIGCRDCWLHISSFIYFISILICIIEKVYLDPTKCHCLLTWQSWYWFEQKLYDKSWPWCSRIIIMKTRTHPGIAHLGLLTQTCEWCLIRLFIFTIPHSEGSLLNPQTWTSCLHLKLGSCPAKEFFVTHIYFI